MVCLILLLRLPLFIKISASLRLVADYIGENAWLITSIERMNQYATIGLLNVPDGDFDSNKSSTYNIKNISGHGLNRTVEWDNVAYSYYLKQYRGEEIMSSNTSVVHSSSRCFWGTVSLRENQERVVDYGKQNTPLGALRLLATTHLFRWCYLRGNIWEYCEENYECLYSNVIWIAPRNYSQLYGDSACATTCKGHHLAYNSQILTLET